MIASDTDFARLLKEHAALIRQYGEAQQRCSRLLQEQAAEIVRLNTQVMRLRAAVVGRDSALAWAREDHAQLAASIPGLPKRIALVRHVEKLTTRIEALVRERPDGARRGQPMTGTAQRRQQEQDRQGARAGGEELAALEASLVAADLVICQTGCLSHGQYWRVQDHCQRTGKACVLTAEPDRLRIVRIHKPDAESDLAGAWVAQ